MTVLKRRQILHTTSAWLQTEQWHWHVQEVQVTSSRLFLLVPFHHPHLHWFIVQCFLDYCCYLKYVQNYSFFFRQEGWWYFYNKTVSCMLNLQRQSFIWNTESIPRVMFKYLLSFQLIFFFLKEEASAACSTWWKTHATLEDWRHF